ncbi:MAG: helix-turn-helix transcriptional regulator [Candidatus Omnitrophica bacterium]|nr:helix-turn-helix transcriptional regulator [Candidatus Omnitrophota bacterium]
MPERIFGQRVKAIRQSLNMSQEELAGKLGVTPQHISAIELDKRMPSLDFLARLAKELDVTTDYLITGEQREHIDSVNAIVADDTLSDEAKHALTHLVKLLRQNKAAC